MHVERNRHSRLYGGENKAREAGERCCLENLSLLAGMCTVQHLSGHFPSDAQNRRHAEVQHRPATARMR